MMSPGMYGIAFILIAIMCFIAWNIGNHNGFRESSRICSQFFGRLRRTNAEQFATIREQSATIDRLTAELQEARDMARKPLTEDQLITCLVAGGLECPRCGNDDKDEMELGEGIDDDADPSLTHQDISCHCCNEKWRLRFRLEAVERGAES